MILSHLEVSGFKSGVYSNCRGLHHYIAAGLCVKCSSEEHYEDLMSSIKSLLFTHIVHLFHY